MGGCFGSGGGREGCFESTPIITKFVQLLHKFSTFNHIIHQSHLHIASQEPYVNYPSDGYQQHSHHNGFGYQFAQNDPNNAPHFHPTPSQPPLCGKTALTCCWCCCPQFHPILTQLFESFRLVLSQYQLLQHRNLNANGTFANTDPNPNLICCRGELFVFCSPLLDYQTLVNHHVASLIANDSENKTSSDLGMDDADYGHIGQSHPSNSIQANSLASDPAPFQPNKPSIQPISSSSPPTLNPTSFINPSWLVDHQHLIDPPIISLLLRYVIEYALHR